LQPLLPLTSRIVGPGIAVDSVGKGITAFCGVYFTVRGSFTPDGHVLILLRLLEKLCKPLDVIVDIIRSIVIPSRTGVEQTRLAKILGAQEHFAAAELLATKLTDFNTRYHSNNVELSEGRKAIGKMPSCFPSFKSLCKSHSDSYELFPDE